MQALELHRWPGNLRELRNAVETALIRAAGAPVTSGHLPDTVTGQENVANSADDTERTRILDTLEQVRWNKSEAAKQLHWSRMTLVPQAGLLPSRAAPRAGANEGVNHLTGRW